MQPVDDKQQDRMKTADALREAADRAALRDDTQYFEQYEAALEAALENGELLPLLESYPDMYTRYPGGAERGSCGAEMHAMFHRAEEKFVAAYYKATVERTGKPPSLELSLTNVRISGAVMPLEKSQDYIDKITAYNNHYQTWRG